MSLANFWTPLSFSTSRVEKRNTPYSNKNKNQALPQAAKIIQVVLTHADTSNAARIFKTFFNQKKTTPDTKNTKLDSKNVFFSSCDKICRGANFCIKSKINKILKGPLITTPTSQLWTGGTPNLNQIAINIILLSINPLLCSVVHTLNKKRIEATLCEIKYFSAISLEDQALKEERRGKMEIILTSKPTQKKNRECLDATINSLKTYMVRNPILAVIKIINP